ncbi:MAG: hypothetical protein JWO76_2249 [Nocardioides sp.]|nr:hypothetical protein [Nocardioides sp.]
MTLPRVLLAVLVLILLSALAVAVGGVVRSTEPRPAPRPLLLGRPAPEPESAAVRVLRAWDVRRARAWSRGETGALRRLYVARSSAARHDVAMLRAWSRRGLRVRGMRMQVLGVDVRAQGPDRIVLMVTDRLTGAVAVGSGTRVPLPRDAASTRTVTLRRVTGEWRVASVLP